MNKPMECQHIFDSDVSDVYPVKSRNISQAGIQVESDVFIPLGSTVSIEVDRQQLSDTIDVKKLQSYVEIEVNTKQFVRLCGKVVRIEYKDEHSFLVAIHLINK